MKKIKNIGLLEFGRATTGLRSKKIPMCAKEIPEMTNSKRSKGRITNKPNCNFFRYFVNIRKKFDLKDSVIEDSVILHDPVAQ